MTPILFQQTATGLVAENQQVRLQLLPVYSTWAFDGKSLTEETECNVWVQGLVEGTVDLWIHDTPAVGFLRDGRTLWGRVHTGDRPGYMRFLVHLDGQSALCADLYVRPSKLDYETHYATMRADLARICRDLVFALPQQTHLAMHLDQGKGTALDFLQITRELLTHLQHTLSLLLHHPDQRLATHHTLRPVSRATGRDPDTLAHLMRTPAFWAPISKTTPMHPLPTSHGCIGYTTVQETHRYPTTNTPANRHLVLRLRQVIQHANALSRLLQSPSHIAHCRQIGTELNRFLKTPVFLQVPSAGAHDPFPQFLSPVYQQAFALIQAFGQALAPMTGGPFDLSYRDTPTLYEYWTWFALIHTLCDMGFSPRVDKGLFHLTHRRLRVFPTQGEPAAIHLQRGDQHIRCLYNPTYTVASGRTLTHDLRPDIIVETHSHTLHAFDAKYRREHNGDCWMPLRDDIDKMHAYRDAIGQIVAPHFERTLKSAVVLFPAPLDLVYCHHAFYTSLPHGIGGLPLLPGDIETQRGLRTYLSDHVLK